MGLDPVTLAVAMGGMAALSSLSQTNAANQQARYQQAQMQANAAAARNQARIAAEKGRIAAENMDREKSAMHREYADIQSGNVASMGALGVDMSSGSAAQVLSGNASSYAADVGANRSQKSVGLWETRQNVRAQEANAANFDSAASYYGSTVKGLGHSLLTAGVQGLVSGISAYSMAGGFAGPAAGTPNAATIAPGIERIARRTSNSLPTLLKSMRG